ncbi:MAG TPA: PadR family transcriptional regulator [Planctomycetaceae bacterium]|nr:PadR family transcriptional regulator [Planctomycetaceae bacterium]
MTERFGPDLLRGSLDLMVLSVLAKESTYGYELQQRLRDASRELVQVQAGTLYPLLHRLEADGLIRSKWDASTGRKRKWYELTAAGRRRLTAQTKEWDRYVACIQSLLAPLRAQQPDPV